MARIIDGKKTALKIKEELKSQVKALKEKGKETGLAVIIAGDNSASRIYVDNKKKDCEYIGINSYEYALSENATQKEVLELIDKLNNDEKIDGMIVQLPLPSHIDEQAVINRISPEKDVDAFHPENVGRIMIGKYGFLPCTPAGIMELLKEENIETKGKNAVVIGRSNIVGKPMALLLINKDATVTVCHSKTQNIAEITKEADILVVAVGKANFVTKDMVKDGAVVIDVGMNRDENGKLCGDVDYEGVSEVCSYITPVPGGVGPMTRAILMKNAVTASTNNLKKI